MLRKLCLLVLIAAYLAACTATPPTVTPSPTLAPTSTLTPPPTSLHVLFIGNSHIFTNNLPEMFAELAQSGGHQVNADASAIGGYTLEQHASNNRTLEKIASNQWDYVILQESTALSPTEAEWGQRLIQAARGLDKTIKDAGAQTILFMTWASASTYAKKGLDGFADEQAQAAAQFLALGQELDAPLAPVGLAWENVLKSKPELELWQSDRVHATRAGTYLMACVFYAVIFQQSPENLSFTANLPEDTAHFLQRIAIETVLAKAPDTAPSSTDSGGLIAFYSERDGNAEIYTMHANGSGLKRLTNNPADDMTPDWSPDGTKFVFVSDRDDSNPHRCFPKCNYEIYVMNADGSEQQRLTDTPAAEHHPVWSPDGSQIAFVSERDGNQEIYVIDADGSDPQRLTDNAADDMHPSWSPDGKQIVFNSMRDGNWDIYVMAADRSGQRPLTSSPAWEFFPTWSPDGKQIAFFACDPKCRPNKQDIYVIDADGSNVQRLTNTPSIVDEDPAWSPDGKRIVFQSDRDGNFEIYVMTAPGPQAPVDVDGSNVQRLTNHRGGDYWPTWQPAPANVGVYLGENTPTSEPVVFRPGSVSTEAIEMDMAIHPNLKEIYFTRLGPGKATLMVSKQSDIGWTTPEPVSFSGQYDDVSPFISANGQILYFSSKRPPAGSTTPREQYHIWFAERTGDGWSNPTELELPIESASGETSPTLTRDGTLYYMADYASLGEGLYRSQIVNGQYQTPQKLDILVNTGQVVEVEPFVAPDESFLLFYSAGRPDNLTPNGRLGDVYISFQVSQGKWSEPQNIGQPANSTAEESTPSLSPDGKYLFFASNRSADNHLPDIYWVRAEFLQSLRTR